jgi:TolB-like protein/Tfp pilus assembly protein PilF
MECPKCHFENPDDTRFCGNCAAPLHPSEEISVTQTKTLETPTQELTAGSTFAGRYQIVEKLGKGGMGKVYRAFDKKLNEDVALKLIKPEIASDQKTIERFSNELKLARKISHRNVGRMYELMEEEGVHFITMEFISGEDLKSLIRRAGPLNIGKTIIIAKQACEGLSEAHRLGIVHRDLKPQNIMIDKQGNARIMDFGIARSHEAEGITDTGVIIGTPKYMSPEQVEGKEIDKRSDIYSLGVILFEVVTGRVPFEGDTPLSIALKTKAEEPPDPREINAQIPEDLSRIILRCMKKDKEERYQSAEDAFFDLRKLEEGMPITDTVQLGKKKKRKRYSFRAFLRELRKRKIIHTLAAFIAGGMLMVEFVHWVLIDHYHFPKQSLDITIATTICALLCTLIWRWFRGAAKKPRRFKVELLAIPLVILVTVFLDVRFFLQMGEPEQIGLETAEEMRWENSIAVLLFEDLSPKRDKDYICEGMTDDIITKLSGLIPQLKVISKRSVVRFKDKEKDISEIGNELGVATILESSLQIEENRIRVISKLINVVNGVVLWSNTFDRELRSVFEVQDEISMAIAKALKVRLVDDRIQTFKAREPTDVEAYKYYQLGNHFERKYRDSSKEEDFKVGVEMFDKAIEIDRHYALVYWGLGNIYEAHFVKEDNKKDLDLMLRAYEKAYEINPNLAEANLGLGWAYFYKEDLDKSYQFFKRALEIDSNNPSINFYVGSFLRSIGLYPQAIEYYSRAIELDPLNITSHWLRAVCYWYIGEFEEAAIYIKRALEIEPDNVRLYLVYARQLIMMKMYEQAEKEIEKAEKLKPDYPRLQYYQAWLLAAKGEKEKALALIRTADFPYLYHVTSIYSLLGMKEEAIKGISEGIDKGFQDIKDYLYSYPFLINNPFYDNLRDDPRFQEIVKREKKKYEQKLEKYGGL